MFACLLIIYTFSNFTYFIRFFSLLLKSSPAKGSSNYPTPLKFLHSSRVREYGIHTQIV